MIELKLYVTREVIFFSSLLVSVLKVSFLQDFHVPKSKNVISMRLRITYSNLNHLKHELLPTFVTTFYTIL